MQKATEGRGRNSIRRPRYQLQFTTESFLSLSLSLFYYYFFFAFSLSFKKKKEGWGFDAVLTVIFTCYWVWNLSFGSPK